MRQVAVLVLVGCSGAAAPALPDARVSADVFIAFRSSFDGFRGWTSFHDDGPADDGSFPADVLGPRTQYVNRLPPHGAAEFPIGTIIVEARESGSRQIFAAVKRGGDFNLGGARNWEWFELAEAEGEVLIVWRGFGPPTNEMYGGDPNGGCNACHAACGAGNDFVCSPKLSLARF